MWFEKQIFIILVNEEKINPNLITTNILKNHTSQQKRSGFQAISRRHHVTRGRVNTLCLPNCVEFNRRASVHKKSSLPLRSERN